MSRNEIVLDVTRERVPVPRRLLKTIFANPTRWTVVPRPHDAVNVPSDWGARYGVCPACQGRAPIRSYRLDMPCPHCRGVFAIAWDEHYLRKR